MKTHKNKIHYIRSKVVPYFVLPAAVGVVTGILIFLFKVVSTRVMHLSVRIYDFVRSDVAYLPLLLVGVTLIGVCSALILKYARECRGGGIPTAVASIRGLIPLKWVQGIFVLFGSSLLTYISGVPLGNEGPSVQMGAALGEGSSRLLGSKKLASERYTMTAGACAGFAIVTGAPLSGILFGLEEAHRRFSAAIFIVASVAVLTGTVTQELLSAVFGVDTTFFDLTVSKMLPVKDLWIAALIGIVTGVCSIAFAEAYRFIKRLGEHGGYKVPFSVKIAAIFLSSGLLGFFCEDFVGSGHSLIEKILYGGGVWYILLLAFIVRAVLMIVANSEGVCGGIFVPTLTFGAIISALIADGFSAMGIVDEKYYAVFVVVGMVSFFAASSRTPITAIAFAAEAFFAAGGILPVVVGVAVSYILVEASGRESFTETVIEARTEAAHAGKPSVIVDVHMTVRKGAFAEGMNIRDLLWPPTCVVLSVDKRLADPSLTDSALHEGDLLHLHYQTYDNEKTIEILTHILGEQPIDKSAKVHFGSKVHIVPLD